MGVHRLCIVHTALLGKQASSSSSLRPEAGLRPRGRSLNVITVFPFAYSRLFCKAWRKGPHDMGREDIHGCHCKIVLNNDAQP